MIAAVRARAANPGAPQLITIAIGTPASQAVNVSDPMLKRIRCSGLRAPTRNVHWVHALTVAMHTACAGPNASSAQKLIAWDNDRFDWLRPSGRSILIPEVTIPSAINNAKSPGE